MSKSLSSVLNGVVRNLFEDEEYGGAKFDWDSVDGPETYKGEDGNTYYKMADDTPKVVETYERPATNAERVGAALGGAWDKTSKAAGEFGDWLQQKHNESLVQSDLDKKILSGAGQLKDAASGLVDSGIQSAKDLAVKHGSSIPGVGRQIEDWGYENNPNVNFLDRAGKFFRRTGEDISDAYGSAKDAVVGAWNDATPAQKAAALGALGATALASGAGALYLRKKQRAANKAAGRK